MDLFDLSAKITLDTSGYDKGLSDAESKIGGFGDKLKTGLTTVGSIVSGAVVAAAGGIGAIVGKSMNEYAEYEQLVGGMETLFKNAAPKIINNAENAYKTAGLSANDYMSTVTQFAANLINSLDGDTEAAVDYADKAITQMSDNVNKMGTSVESVQNAYRGFARGNFTMLDNLSLGYAGTKEGMQKLLDKAKELSEQQGEYRDFSIESYADIVDAIGLVQDEIGITGTTAKEAEGTITGSLAGVKGAWNNLLTALASGEGVEDKVDTLMDTIGAAADNLIPRFETALQAIPGLIQAVVPKVVEALPGFASEIIPSALGAVGDIVKAVIINLPTLIQSVSDVLKSGEIPKLISDLADTLTNKENTDALIEAGEDLFDSILDNADEIITTLAPKIGTFIENVVTKFLDPDNITAIANKGETFFLHLLDNAETVVNGLEDAVLSIINGLIKVLTDADAMSNLTKAGLKIGLHIAKGVIKGLLHLNLLEKIPGIGGIFSGFSDAIDLAVDKIDEGIDIVSDELADALSGRTHENYVNTQKWIDDLNKQIEATETGALPELSSLPKTTTQKSLDPTMQKTAIDLFNPLDQMKLNSQFGIFEININGDVKAEDVAEEIEDRLTGKMAGKGVLVK